MMEFWVDKLPTEEKIAEARMRLEKRIRDKEKAIWAAHNIYHLPEDIGNLTALVTLDLSMNPLEFLPDSITNLHYLEELSVAKNDLYKLPEISPHHEHLTALNLDANNLHLLPPRLGELPLKYLR